MTSMLFFDWLRRFDQHICKKPSRKVALLVDNCSAHGTSENLSASQQVTVVFLPPNTTSQIQPRDAGIIAAMKVQYRKIQMERALDLIDCNVKDVYKVDKLTGMRWMATIWKELSSETILNCWRHYGTN